MDIQDAQSVTSLRDMVLRRVRADIVSGQSAPGTMYSVPTLAEELGVSTTPVREALLELSLHGLITPVRNRGFRVEATSPDSLRDLFALRVLLERYAMECVARKRLTDTEDLRKLATHVRNLRPYLGVSQFPNPVIGPNGHPIAKPADW